LLTLLLHLQNDKESCSVIYRGPISGYIDGRQIAHLIL